MKGAWIIGVKIGYKMMRPNANLTYLAFEHAVVNKITHYSILLQLGNFHILFQAFMHVHTSKFL